MHMLSWSIDTSACPPIHWGLETDTKSPETALPVSRANLVAVSGWRLRMSNPAGFSVFCGLGLVSFMAQHNSKDWSKNGWSTSSVKHTEIGRRPPLRSRDIRTPKANLLGCASSMGRISRRERVSKIRATGWSRFVCTALMRCLSCTRSPEHPTFKLLLP